MNIATDCTIRVHNVQHFISRQYIFQVFIEPVQRVTRSRALRSPDVLPLYYSFFCLFILFLGFFLLKSFYLSLIYHLNSGDIESNIN